MSKVKAWMQSAQCDIEVTPKDNVSNVSKVSSASSACMKEAANRAALIAKAAALEERQSLEIKEAHIKAEKERLEILTALAEANARIKVYEECEEHQKLSNMDKPMMAKPENAVRGDAKLKIKNTPPLTSRQPRDLSHHVDSAGGMYQLMQRHTDITELLVKNQQLFRLPQKDVPVFHGDPLEYRSFLRAFIHAIDKRADINIDKLYFLEQFTRGEPRNLVKSCQHMPADHGYTEAVRLLQNKYGNELKIAAALMEKSFKWPQVKAEDVKALNAFSLFLVSCPTLWRYMITWKR